MMAPGACRGARGFSLIELMITVAVVSILAAIAFPSYQAYVRRANRTVAKAVLADIYLQQQSWMTDRKAFATSLATLGYPAVTFYVDTNGTKAAANTGAAIYSVTLESASASAYVAAAAPLGSQTQDTDCGSLKISQSGNKTATGPKGVDCWKG